MIFQFTGISPRTGELFLGNEPHVGGWGASQGRDGEDGMIWTLSGNFHDMPIEVFESKFPAHITEYDYRQDSAGPGRWREGNGIIREYRMTTDTRMSLWFERSANPAWGLFGGQDGAPPKSSSTPHPPKGPPPQDHPYAPPPRRHRPLPHRRRRRLWQPPRPDPQAVQADLADGHITPDYARRSPPAERRDSHRSLT